MMKMIFDICFKIGIMILCLIFLMLLSDLIDNLGNGRYQLETDSDLILDTKTGKFYQNRYGQLQQVTYDEDGYPEELYYDKERYQKELQEELFGK
jgi:hypothetical protein